MEELKLELKNRAISRAATGISTTAQVTAVASAFCWPLGLVVGGWLGVAALAAAAVTIMGGSLAAIKREIAAIEGGDKDVIRQWLTDTDLSDIGRRHGVKGAPQPKKIEGDGEKPAPAPSPSGKTRTAPTAVPPVAGKEEIGGEPLGESLAPAAVEPPRGAIQRGVLALRPETHLKLLAPSRGGKTNTLLHLLKDAPRVTYLTLKASDRVPHHWQGYRLRVGQIHRDVGCVLGEIEPLVQRILDGSDPQEHWLVVDEALVITDLLQGPTEEDEDKGIARRFSSLIKLHLATGAAQGARLVLMSQTPNGTDIKGISAASLQNLWTVICGSEKCAEGMTHLVPWYQKHVANLAPEQVTELQGLTAGFWQLASVRGIPTLCNFPQFEADLKPCVIPGILPPLRVINPTEAAILEHLTRAGEAKTPGRLRADVRVLKDLPLEQLDRILENLVTRGYLAREESDRTLRYQAVDTAPESPPEP